VSSLSRLRALAGSRRAKLALEGRGGGASAKRTVRVDRPSPTQRALPSVSASPASGRGEPCARAVFRHCERSEAIHRAASEQLDCFASLAMTARHAFAFPRRALARVMHKSPPQRAWGMPGARCARSLVGRKKQPHQYSHHRSPDKPGIPARNGLNSCFVLSPVNGLSCHRRLADICRSAPGRADLPPQDLTPASRRQDRTTSLYAAPVYAKGFDGVKCPSSARPLSLTALASRPAIRLRASTAASTASRSNVRDDRETPLWCGTGWREI
jgi:hypothetical protein